MAYAAAAAIGAGLLRAAWVGGGIFLGLNLALAFAVTLGIVLAGYGSAAGAWTAYVLTIPFMLPYFLGAELVKHDRRTAPSANEKL